MSLFARSRARQRSPRPPRRATGITVALLAGSLIAGGLISPRFCVVAIGW